MAYFGEGERCPFCTRNSVMEHDRHDSTLRVCSACGYEEEVYWDVSEEDWRERYFVAPEPRPELGFPKLYSYVHDLALYGWLDKLLWALSEDLSELDAHETLTGWTLLHAAAAGNQVTIIRHLLLYGVDLEAPDCSWGTALHVSARWGCHDAAALLLGAGAAVEARNAAGQTPEEVALAHGQVWP